MISNVNMTAFILKHSWTIVFFSEIQNDSTIVLYKKKKTQFISSVRQIYYQPSHLILDNMRYSRCRTFGL